MWFKQMQLFALENSIRNAPEDLIKLMEPMVFTPCLPSLPMSMGWTAPVDEEQAPLVLAMNGYMMICLQIEEKILPAAVIRQETEARVKQLEAKAGRKIRQKEKLALRDDITVALLPRAFSKLIRIYGYIDTKNNWLVLGTANEKRTEQFIAAFKKSISDQIHSVEVKKLAPILTHWLKHKSYPATFSIEKNCVLQDPNQQNRVIRCQQQDLFATGIQSLLKDGCEAKQLALAWHDRVKFVLSAADFSLRSVQFQEALLTQAEDLEAEGKQQQFFADFFIMTETFSQLLLELLQVFLDTSKQALQARADDATLDRQKIVA